MMLGLATRRGHVGCARPAPQWWRSRSRRSRSWHRRSWRPRARMGRRKLCGLWPSGRRRNREREWRQVTDKPLRLLARSLPGGQRRRRSIGPTDRPPPGLLELSVALGRCRGGSCVKAWPSPAPIEDPVRLRALDRIVIQGQPGRRQEVELRRRWLGFAGPPQRFVIAVVPSLGFRQSASRSDDALSLLFCACPFSENRFPLSGTCASTDSGRA